MANGIGVFQRRQNSPIIIAQSAVAVSVTGTLTETTLATITIPGGSMGANGSLRITPLFSYTNSANTKTVRARLGGVLLISIPATTTASLQTQTNVRNRASNQQIVFASGASYGTTASAANTTAINTSIDQTLTITGQLALDTETITLEGYTVEVLPSA